MSSAGITPRIAFRTDNYELCRSLVGRGLGYTLLMWRDTPRETWDGGEVVFLPIHPTPREVSVLALWRPGSPDRTHRGGASTRCARCQRHLREKP